MVVSATKSMLSVLFFVFVLVLIKRFPPALALGQADHLRERWGVRNDSHRPEYVGEQIRTEEVIALFIVPVQGRLV